MQDAKRRSDWVRIGSPHSGPRSGSLRTPRLQTLEVAFVARFQSSKVDLESVKNAWGLEIHLRCSCKEARPKMLRRVWATLPVAFVVMASAVDGQSHESSCTRQSTGNVERHMSWLSSSAHMAFVVESTCQSLPNLGSSSQSHSQVCFTPTLIGVVEWRTSIQSAACLLAH